MNKTIYVDETMMSAVMTDGEKSSSVLYTTDGINFVVETNTK